MADGLTARQLRELLDEHGTLDAAAAARPDLADDLRDARNQGEKVKRLLEGVAGEMARTYEGGRRPRIPKLRLSSPQRFSAEEFAKAKFERDVAVHEEALERHSRKRGDTASGSGVPGRRHNTIPAKTFWLIYERGLERVASTSSPKKPSYQGIADKTVQLEALDRPGIVAVKRDWLTPIVKWIEADPRRARRYFGSRKIPSEFSAIVRG
jgi:hypothetical protein